MNVSDSHRRRYLIIANKTGQLGNRLVIYAHMLAAGFERDWTVLNPSFCEYAHFFTGTTGRLWTCGDEQVNTPIIPLLERQVLYRMNRVGYQASKILARIPYSGVGWAKVSNSLHYDLTTLVDRAEQRHWRAVFTQNYHFRQHEWCARHGERIRALLMPMEPWRTQAENTVRAARQIGELGEIGESRKNGKSGKPGEQGSSNVILVGVHIRHGDYLHHLAGKFFYDVSTYANLMRQVQSFLAPQRVVFLVCSNAHHQPDDFLGLNVTFGPGHLVSDLHALSLCDYLFGPPSSFSAWAAYHGKVRYHMVENIDDPLTAAHFAVPASPDPRY